jgi:hypothetical protein
MTNIIQSLLKTQKLGWEIALALAVKILLLLALWFLIFHWLDRPVAKFSIEERFALPLTAVKP